MDAPRIQYATTSDGVSIAFSTLGEGLPFVYTPSGPFQHIQLEWGFPEIRRWYERLAERRRLVLYNERGGGLSDRDIGGYSLDAEMRDLEAVVEALRLERFALFGFYHGGPAAIAYAARHPQRVSHLILWQTWSRARDRITGSPRVQAVRSLLEQDWELYTETLAHELMGWPEGEPARRYAAFVREVTTQEAMLTFLRATNEYDVTALLPQLLMPTLVLHRRQHARVPLEIARGLVSRIPDARLVFLEGTGGQPYLGDTDSVLRTIDEFLGDGEDKAAQASASSASAVHTILFTDIEGSTTLTQRLGDDRAQQLLGTHNTIVRDSLKARGGTEIKHTGDGIMASFPSASRAIECAIAIQQHLTQRNESSPETAIRVRIGLNAGEPVAEAEDLFGTAVQLAARVCAQAEADQILASNVVRELAAGKGFLFSDQGNVALRGFEEPVRVYEVRWEKE